jgi:hypothetical protein
MIITASLMFEHIQMKKRLKGRKEIRPFTVLAPGEGVLFVRANQEWFVYSASDPMQVSLQILKRTKNSWEGKVSELLHPFGLAHEWLHE